MLARSGTWVSTMSIQGDLLWIWQMREGKDRTRRALQAGSTGSSRTPRGDLLPQSIAARNPTNSYSTASQSIPTSGYDHALSSPLLLICCYGFCLRGISWAHVMQVTRDNSTDWWAEKTNEINGIRFGALYLHVKQNYFQYGVLWYQHC